MSVKPLILLVLFTSVLGFGQDNSIFGKVVDEQGQPISFANVILLTQMDSTIVAGTSTDDQGYFKLNARTQITYNFRISYIGYKDILKEIMLNEDTDLGTITLLEEAQSLDEISITFQKPTLKKEADRLVFNVENSALVEGNILQVLKSTPGVLVINNALTVKNTTPTVYINDRKVNLTSSELTQLLESSTANAIKTIEVITNPSAKYDASSGIVVNIMMSKNLVTGYRGNVFSNYTQATFPNYNFGTGHFFKSDKINFYANYSYSDNKLKRDDRESINYFDDNQNIDQIWKSRTNRNKWPDTHNFNMNFDFAFEDKSFLNLSTSMLFLPNYKYIKANNTNVFDASENLDFYFDSNNLERDKKHNLAFDIGFVHQFSKGTLSLNSHYTDYNFRQYQDVASNYYDYDGSFLAATAFNQRNVQDTQIFAAQADVSHSFEDGSTLEIGAKSSHIETNSATTRNDIVNGQEIMDPNNTDDFDYKENIQAAYTNYSYNSEKWNISLGLRAEQTNIKSQSFFNHQNNRQNYLKWFPNTSINHELTENWSFHTNYKRSIERPSYSNLNPFRFYFNDNNILVGNPNLKPITIDYFDIGTTLFDFFSFDAYYKSSKHNIYTLPIQDNANNILIYTPLNFDETIEYGFDFMVNFYATPNWSIYFLTSFYNIEDQTVFENSLVNQDQWSNYSIFQNDFTFLEDRSLNINFTIYFVGKNLQGFRVVENRWVSSLSLSKSILNKKAVISLSAENLFNAQDYNDSTRYLNQYSKIHTSLDERLIKLGFRYNFGNTSLKASSESKSLDERERLKETNN